MFNIIYGVVIIWIYIDFVIGYYFKGVFKKYLRD